VGRFVTKRQNITLAPEVEATFADKLKAVPASFAGVKVKNKVTIDGTKFIMDDGSWLLFRKSGTEPVVRLYVEAASDERLKTLLVAGKEFILR
jgi:phosphomannomutase